MQATSLGYATSLDAPLLRLTNGDPWTVADSLEGVQAFGVTGGGKTSGVGTTLPLALLKAGYGLIVFCAKVDEGERWLKLARATGRAGEVFHVTADGQHTFNFMNWAMSRPEASTGNTVELFMRLLDAMRINRGAGGEQQFWDDAARQLFSQTIDALWWAYGRIRFDDVLKLVDTAPLAGKDEEANYKAGFCYQTLKKAFEHPAKPRDTDDLDAVNRYFTQRFAKLADKTRSSIIMTLSVTLDAFLKGPLRRLFATTTTVVPEIVFEGGILIIDIPIKRNERDAVLAAHVFKYCFQKAAERRAIGPQTRPLCLFADEAQFFVSGYDFEFLSTARSARVCNVYMTQNLPMYRAVISTPRPQEAVNALVANLKTKVFHQNNDPETNRYASELIGKRWQMVENYSTSDQLSESTTTGTSYQFSENASRGHGYGGNFMPGSGSGQSYNSNWNSGEARSEGRNDGKTRGTTRGTSHGAAAQRHDDVPPEFFSRNLRSGGARHRFRVDALLFQDGRQFHPEGHNYTVCSFDQRATP